MARELIPYSPGMQGGANLVRGRVGGGRFHRHDDLEFNLVVDGRASYLVEDRRYNLRAGTLIWLYPEQDHVLIDETLDFAMWVVVFRPELVDRVCVTDRSAELRRGKPTLPIQRRLPSSAVDELEGVMRRLDETSEEPDFVNAGLDYLLQLAWRSYRRAEQIEEGEGVDPAVEKVARLLRDETLAENIEELADRVGLSPTRLSRLFLKQAGVSITQYRQRCCLDRFVQRYGKGRRLNMTESALAAGFGSYAQFHRVFKQYFGYGPAEYRRRLQEDA